MSKMLKFMKPQSKSVPPERLQKQKELFVFSESCFHGFPSKPSALAWDPKLSLLAIATKSGSIRVYGKPGVEFYGQHENSDASITKLCFLPGQMSLVSLCDDNTLDLWIIRREESKETLVRVKSSSLEGKLKKISAIVPDEECKCLLVGTEGGNIYLLDISTFTMTNDIIYQDVVMQNVPEDYKVNPGPVEVIITHPTETSKILVGYQRGLIVLWDRKAPCAEQTYVTNQQLESLCWNADASEFMSCHNDGSFIIWETADCKKAKEGPTTVYGPFPCKAINKISWLEAEDGYLTIFNGGMARANHWDRNTVTVMQGEKHVTFNLTSRVIDFIATKHPKIDEPSTLIILAEEEIIFIDLSSDDWLPFKNEYLSSLHSSAVTCSTLVSDVDQKVFDKIKAAGVSSDCKYSKNPWPITGGNANFPSETSRNILITGHEDGSVRFWDCCGLCVTPLYKMSTAVMFISDDFCAEAANEDDDDWPPFRKAGVFDPFSDDGRLGIKKVEMCPHTGHVVIAGTAGQIIISEIVPDRKEFIPECVEVNLVADTDGFVWKSHSKLDMYKEPIKFGPGLHPTVVVQFYPPASCTSINLHSEWGLLAMGTAHGFSLFDYFTKKNLLTKSTLSANDIANTCDEGPMSRRKSLKKSLRESFRRLRKGRSQRKPKAKDKQNIHINAKILKEEAEVVAKSRAADIVALSDLDEIKCKGDIEDGDIEEAKVPLNGDRPEVIVDEGSDDLPFLFYVIPKDLPEKLKCGFRKLMNKRKQHTSDENVLPFFFYVKPKHGLKNLVKLRRTQTEEGMLPFFYYVQPNWNIKRFKDGFKQGTDDGAVPFFYYVNPKHVKFPKLAALKGKEKSERDPNDIPFLFYITPMRFRREKTEKDKDYDPVSGGSDDESHHLASVSLQKVKDLRQWLYNKRNLVKLETKTAENPIPFLFYVTPKNIFIKKETKEKIGLTKEETFDHGNLPFLFYVNPKNMKMPPVASTLVSLRDEIRKAIDSMKRNETITGSGEGENVVESKSQEKLSEECVKKDEETFSSSEPANILKAESYDLAVSSLYEVPRTPKIPQGLFRIGASKLKSMFKKSQQPKKEKELPIAATKVPDLGDRHPSIETYIDETPISLSPMVLPNPTTASSHCTNAPATRPDSSPSLLTHKSLYRERPESLCSSQSSVKERAVKRSLKSLTTDLTFKMPFVSPTAEEDGMKPVERAIEARTHSGDYIGSMVRCLHLTKCYLASNQLMSATLWAGTNGGAIFVYTIFIPPSEKRMEIPLTVQLGKEIHLKHAAPVINVTILDGASRPFPEPLAVKKGAATSPDNSGSHRVLISSEEQFKVFTLPQLKPYCKYKLTAHEGSRLRKIGFSKFTSVVDGSYTEDCFMVVTNLGDISVFSLPGAKRQVQALYIKKEDISGINSVMFTKRGEAMFLVSASEIARISLSTRCITCPKGTVHVTKKEESKMAPPNIQSSMDGVLESSPKSMSSLKKIDENRESADTSLISADITIDSIRDHLQIATEEASKCVEKAIDPPAVTSSSSASETITMTESTVKEESHTTKSVTIVKTSTVVSSQAEASSVQVVETAQSPDEPPTVNGDDDLSAIKDSCGESKKVE